ncbi:His/Gly/Thr/Pro-type tRNA ligase C-terminal domain-containing protein, partial [Enterococcus faecium]|uniref:His/Gly/Thr/Pro-type tRNA ligase C-terminal domain-containing protein n=1 Tax=Enterococcus faecium TaxID=1352 RepID=UPI0034E93548
VLIPVNNDLHLDYVNRIKRQMQAAGLRVKVDDRNEKMGYKISEAQTKKVPYTVVVGDKELNDAAVSVRRYGDEHTEEEAGNMFIDAMVAEVKNYSRDGKT